jgi:hypothetical protein
MEYQLKEECNLRDCAVDCVVESTWSECSAECGPGVQKRNVVTQETNGGKACPALEMACELGSCNCDSDLAGTYVTAYRTGTPSYDTVPNVAGTIAYDRTERNQCIVNVTPPGSTSFKLKVYGNVLRQGNTAIATWNSSSRSLAWVDSIGYTWVKSITCDPQMAGTYVEYNGGDVSQQVTITMNTNTCTGTVLSSTTTNVSFNGRTIMLPFNVSGTFNPGTGNVADSITFSNGLVWKKGDMPSCPFAGGINGIYNYNRDGIRVATNNSVTMNATTCTGVAVMDNVTYAATMSSYTISVPARSMTGTYDSGSRSIRWNDGNTWTR